MKQLLEIRKLHAEASKAKLPNDIVDKIANEVQKRLSDEIKGHVEKVMDAYKGEAGRKNELTTSLNGVLRGLLARIERGMTVELRIAPPASVGTEGNPSEEAKQYGQVSAIIKDLKFPPPSEEHFLQLTHGGESGTANDASRDGGEGKPGSVPKQ